MEQYETLEELGSGAFAIVMKAKEIKTGDLVAIKILKKKFTTWEECKAMREVKALDKLKNSESIIKLKEIFGLDNVLHLVFEYMEKDLYKLITQRQNKKFNEGQIKCIMFQVLNGVAYMHKYGFFHRDLKPENLLVNGDNVKLADFGLARETRSLPPYTDYIATRWYRAPECILKSTNYSSAVDIWAIGCIMAELYNLVPLFTGKTEKELLFKICSVLGAPTYNNWSEGLLLSKKLDIRFPISNCVPFNQILPDASKDAVDFLSEMLKWDPNSRASAVNLLQHPFFTRSSIPTRILTPEIKITDGHKYGKRYSNTKHFNSNNSNNSNNTNNNKNLENFEALKVENEKNEDALSNILKDTKGFENCKKFY